MTDVKAMIASLPADAQVLVDAWVAELRAELRGVPDEARDEIASEVVAHVADALGTDAGADEVASVLAEFGTSSEYATAVREALDEGSEFRMPVTGRILGMPYEWRMPTTARVRSRWWDTSNSKVLVPKIFGVGWTINFGGLAVKLGLLHADDGDEPFESVPDSFMWTALAVPTVLVMAFVGIWFVKHGVASAQVPTHWGPSGAADGWSSKNSVLAITFAALVIPYLWAVWGYVSRDSKFSRVIICAFAASIEILGLTIYSLSILEVVTSNPVVLGSGLVLPILVIPFAMLVGFARIGMRQDMNRA
jgi:hypothetical protein